MVLARIQLVKDALEKDEFGVVIHHGQAGAHLGTVGYGVSLVLEHTRDMILVAIELEAGAVGSF